MSENIPESIPTSQDPRSKRPLKKRALSPRSQTAAQITSLFTNPEKAVLPTITSPSTALTTNKSTNVHAPPEIVQNVQGSSAGAGSGEFHVYKASRRREYERLRGMEEEVREEEEGERWEREKKEREARDAEKTRKNREKRERSKKKGKKGGAGEKDAEGEKGGKFKARVEVKEGLEGLGGEGPRVDEGENGKAAVAAAEEVGLVIHDDD